ncbi:MAG: hypothetical protein OEX02_02895 [Cyclobacteriaceae bacterium]|nr:hypothetical protein [Cyclobacteriaceae bacterium]
MRVKFSFTQLALVLMASCAGFNSDQVDYIAEVKSLNATESQVEYLMEIGRIDQGIRQLEKRILDAFGYDSKEYQEMLETMVQVDNENLAKIEAFLEVYGHPTIEEYGKKAANVPWYVIHHATGGMEPRIRNFKHIYRAWKKGDIEGGAVSFYLGRMHRIKFDQRFDMPGPFQREAEIDTLIQLLGLEQMRTEVEEGL